MQLTAASLTFKAWLLQTLTEWQPILAFLTPALVLLSAGIAWLAIRKNQDVNRHRATLDLIEKSESSEHYRVILTTFREYLLDGDEAQRARIHEPRNDAEKLARRQIQQFLNHYELVAIGTLGKSLHEKTYRDWMMTVVIRDWNAAADYVQRERWKYDEAAKDWRYEKRVYENLEKLVVKWGKRCKRQVREISKEPSRRPAASRGAADMTAPLIDKTERAGARSDATKTPSKPTKTRKKP